jgi:hypothetical protein
MPPVKLEIRGFERIRQPDSDEAEIRGGGGNFVTERERKL